MQLNNQESPKIFRVPWGKTWQIVLCGPIVPFPTRSPLRHLQIFICCSIFRELLTERYQSNVPKQKFLNVFPQTNALNQEFPNDSSQANVPKRTFLNERFKTDWNRYENLACCSILACSCFHARPNEHALSPKTCWKHFRQNGCQNDFIITALCAFKFRLLGLLHKKSWKDWWMPSFPIPCWEKHAQTS